MSSTSVPAHAQMSRADLSRRRVCSSTATADESMAEQRSKSSSRKRSGKLSSSSVVRCARTSSTTELAEPKKIIPCKWTTSVVAPNSSSTSCSAGVRATLERSSSSVACCSTPEWREYWMMKITAVKSSPSTTAYSMPSAAVSATCTITSANSRLGKLVHACLKLSTSMLRPEETRMAANIALGTKPTIDDPVRKRSELVAMTIAGATLERAPRSYATTMPRYVTVGVIMPGDAASCEKPLFMISAL
mmetsp:Transcript_57508/g.157920  ORF Transcript_57508/g.157920 Transcript_57508/m.157920 type:complete len:247 (+) Transcript_57508:1996-2736(+)